jgi:hypothetical protein
LTPKLAKELLLQTTTEQQLCGQANKKKASLNLPALDRIMRHSKNPFINRNAQSNFKFG